MVELNNLPLQPTSLSGLKNHPSFWQGLSRAQRVSLLIFLFLLIVLPMSIGAINKPTNPAPSAQVLVTPPVTPPPTSYPTIDETFEAPVLSIAYIPLVGDTINNDITGDVGTTSPSELLKKVNLLNGYLLDSLTKASIYHGYKDSTAKPSLTYRLLDNLVNYSEVPTEEGTPSRPADHVKILTGSGFNICDYVENKGVKEVWLWMYHTDKVYPVESYQIGPGHALGNGYMNLPLCKKTYRVYDYNYGRGLGEALEDHTHHLEVLFNYISAITTAQLPTFYSQNFIDGIGSQPSPAGFKRCGNTHCSPNVTATKCDYQWYDETQVSSDCLDWNPDRTGKVTPLSCLTWKDTYNSPTKQYLSGKACPDDGGVAYKVWWMQNHPGLNNNLYYNGKKLKNWWIFLGDFDRAITDRSLWYSQSSPGPTPTTWPTVTPIPTFVPTPIPTVRPTPTSSPAPSLVVSTNKVILSLVKDYSSPSGLTMKEALTISNKGTSAITWQLKNNQDAAFIPAGGTSQPILGQGFGFYESSGGIAAGQSVVIRAYVNNNLKIGLYYGSYTLQEIVNNTTRDISKINYGLTVTEPISNYLPVILTQSLPTAGIFRDYSATISGYDQDSQDILKMTISNLPLGTYRGPCSVTVGGGEPGQEIDCQISGRPLRPGTYSVNVLLEDNHGGRASKALYLKVNWFSF